MAWKRVVRFVRPNDSIDFENLTNSENQYIHNNYVTSNKCDPHSVVVSANGLERHHTRIFTNESNRNEFVADSSIQSMHNRRTTANTSNGITGSVTFDAEYNE